jgi:hypothetical protein
MAALPASPLTPTRLEDYRWVLGFGYKASKHKRHAFYLQLFRPLFIYVELSNRIAIKKNKNYF